MMEPIEDDEHQNEDLKALWLQQRDASQGQLIKSSINKRLGQGDDGGDLPVFDDNLTSLMKEQRNANQAQLINWSILGNYMDEGKEGRGEDVKALWLRQRNADQSQLIRESMVGFDDIDAIESKEEGEQPQQHEDDDEDDLKSLWVQNREVNQAQLIIRSRGQGMKSSSWKARASDFFMLAFATDDVEILGNDDLNTLWKRETHHQRNLSSI